DPGALADQQHLHPRPVPGHRPDHGRRRLDRARLRPAPATGDDAGAIAGLTAPTTSMRQPLGSRVAGGGWPMRWIYLAVVVLFAGATLVFALQNLDTATVAFLGFRVRAPLAALTIIVYLLGAATGGSLLALLRRSYAGSKRAVVSS